MAQTPWVGVWWTGVFGAAGSGDPEWEVTAFEHLGDRWIRYREMKQDERQPSELWEIAAGLSHGIETRPR